MASLFISHLVAVVFYATMSFVPAQKPPAVVFGAGLDRNKPSAVLQDRLDTAFDLYKRGIVSAIFLSGDSVSLSHDEVGVMASYLVGRGVPTATLIKDPQGLDTYSTCIHAKDQFGVGRVMLVTQAFHMQRAKYLCEGVGLKVQSVVADRREYADAKQYAQREKEAMVKAWLQLNTTLKQSELDALEASGR